MAAVADLVIQDNQLVKELVKDPHQIAATLLDQEAAQVIHVLVVIILEPPDKDLEADKLAEVLHTRVQVAAALAALAALDKDHMVAKAALEDL
jgi:hypothetical protein